jgi:hypothetical protein
MNDFLWGAISVTCFAIAMHFLRFWSESRDRLFAFFGLAFVTLGVNWLLLEIFQPPTETRHLFYLLRLLAFVLIIAGILDKNLAGRRG